MPAPWVLVCRRCGRVWARSEPGWRCRCGGLFDLQGPRADPLSPGAASGRCGATRSSLPCSGERVTLGEGLTPLVPVRPGLWCKLDYVIADRVLQGSGGDGADERGGRAWRRAGGGRQQRQRRPIRGRLRGTSRDGGRGVRPGVDASGPGGRRGGARRPGGRRAGRPGGGRGGSPVRGGGDRGVVRQPRLPPGVRPRGQDTGLRAARAARRSTGDGRGARRQRHAGAGAVAGLPGARRPPAPDRRRAGRTLCATGRPGPDRSDGRVGHRHPGAASRRRGTGCRPGDRRRRRHGPRGRPRPRRRRAGPPGLRRGAHRSSGVGCPAGPRGRS